MLKIERIETIFSQGTSERREDGLINNQPFFGVVDGVTAPYSPSRPPTLFEGMSGAEMVRKLILETFYAAKFSLPLKKVVLEANRKIREFHTTQGIPLKRSDLLSGATFAFAKIGKTIEIIQGGDCFAVWVINSEIGITKDQTQLAAHHRLIPELMKKYEGNREKMWNEFYPHLCALRQRDYNQKIETGFAVLNGQPWVSECWQKIEVPSRDLELLLLFTDGLVPVKERNKEEKLAKKVIALYREKGLVGILERTRRIEEQQKESSHIDHEEATAIAIQFAPEGLFFIFWARKK